MKLISSKFSALISTSFIFHLVPCLLLLAVSYFSLAAPAFAQSTSDLEKELADKQKQIQELTQKLSEAKEQEKTLNSQLQYIDGQTKLTQLKIEQTEYMIIKLDKEIEELGSRIERLSTTVDSLTEVLLQRIVQTYKYSQLSPLELLFSSKNFSDLLERVKYIQVAQANDKKVLYELQATKQTYNDQQTDKKSRQDEQEKLKQDLEKYKTQLADQKKAKEDLLRVTKNDEKRYQELIAKLRADTESISRALANKGVQLGPVKKGERIASVGNSGCSTGPHLHFEVMTPAKVENGIIVGRENKVDPLPYIESGRFTKPVSGYTGRDCSQNGTCYNGDITTRFGQVYFLGTHSGLDIAQTYGTSIYAVEDGVAYQTQDSKACYLTGTAGKGVFVDHGNGIVTLYWHIP